MCLWCGWAQAKPTVIVITCEALAGSLATGVLGAARGKGAGLGVGAVSSVQTVWPWAPPLTSLTLSLPTDKMKGLAHRTSETLGSQEIWTSSQVPSLVFPALAWPYMYTERDHGQGVAGGLQEDLPLPCLLSLAAFSQDTQQGRAR